MTNLWLHLEECYGFLPFFNWMRFGDMWLKRKLFPYVFPFGEALMAENIRMRDGILEITRHMPNIVDIPIILDGGSYSSRKIDDILLDLYVGNPLKL